jgi:hypothetical protein
MSHIGPFCNLNRSHPWTRSADTPAGQLVRLWDGDASLDESEWVCRATMEIRGQVGFSRDRRSLQYETTLVAYSRRGNARYLKQIFTSATYGKGVEYGTIAQEIAVQQLGLSATETARFPTSLGKVTQFSANSIVDLTPLEAIDKILETVGLTADFDGAGVLRTYSRDIRRGADLRYEKEDLIFAERIVGQETESYNSVSVKGLSKNIVEREQPEQALARATIPVGFWKPSHRVHVQWSEDNSLRARRTQLKILSSVNEGLWFDLGTEAYDEASEFGGLIRVDITNYLLSLLAVMTTAGIAAAALPDETTPVVVRVDTVTGVGRTYPELSEGGPTLPYGRIAQGVFQLLAMQTLSLQASPQYEIWGVPVISVYEVKCPRTVYTDVNDLICKTITHVPFPLYHDAFATRGERRPS